MFTNSNWTKPKPKTRNEISNQHLHTYQGEVIRKSINAPNPSLKVQFTTFRKKNSIAKCTLKQINQKRSIMMVDVWWRESKFPSKQHHHQSKRISLSKSIALQASYVSPIQQLKSKEFLNLQPMIRVWTILDQSYKNP